CVGVGFVVVVCVLGLGVGSVVGGGWDGLYAGLQYGPLETSAGRRKTHKVDRARQVQGGTWPLVAAASAGWQDAALHELLDPCRPGAHRGSIARNRETENGPGGSGLRTLCKHRTAAFCSRRNNPGRAVQCRTSGSHRSGCPGGGGCGLLPPKWGTAVRHFR